MNQTSRIEGNLAQQAPEMCDDSLENELPPELEVMLKDAVQLAAELDLADDPEEVEAKIKSFAARHKIDVAEATSVLEIMMGDEEEEAREKRNPQQELEKSLQISDLIGQLQSCLSAEAMNDKLKAFNKETGGKFDISAIVDIIENNKDTEGEYNVGNILRQLTELQEGLTETIHELEKKTRAEEDADPGSDYDMDTGKKKKKKLPAIKKAGRKEVTVSTPESRKREREQEFIAKFASLFRQLQAENISDLFSFERRLQGMRIDTHIGTRDSGWTHSETLHFFVTQYGDPSSGTRERVKDLFELFQDKKNELDPFMFARHVLMYHGDGSYSNGFIKEDPSGVEGTQVYIK
ncbi:hypothetical protein KJ903_01935 [Patescibacteria group bacterium]|nr:hypothetical protein [Patescibacteria group bacterium]